MKTCSKYQELLASYLDHTCTQEENQELLAHFASCAACRTQAEELTALLTLLSSETEEEPPVDLHEKIMASLTKETPKKTVFFYQRLVPYGIIAAVFVIFFSFGEPRIFSPLFGTSQDMTAKRAASTAAAPMAPAAITPGPQAPALSGGASLDTIEGAPTAGPEMKIQAAPPESAQSNFSAQMENPSTSALQINPPAAAAPAPRVMAEKYGFTAHLYTKGLLSLAEIASRLDVSIEKGAAQLVIPRELLPRLSEINQELGFTLDIQSIDDALAFGVLEVID